MRQMRRLLKAKQSKFVECFDEMFGETWKTGEAKVKPTRQRLPAVVQSDAASAGQKGRRALWTFIGPSISGPAAPSLRASSEPQTSPLTDYLCEATVTNTLKSHNWAKAALFVSFLRWESPWQPASDDRDTLDPSRILQPPSSRLSLGFDRDPWIR